MKKLTDIKKLADAAGKDLGIDTFSSFFLQIDALGELLIKGGKKMVVCKEDEILLDCDGLSVRIEGAGLRVNAFSETETLIGGSVETVSFRREAPGC